MQARSLGKLRRQAIVRASGLHSSVDGAIIPSQQSGARAGQGRCAAQKVKAGDASLRKQLHDDEGGLRDLFCTLLPTTPALLDAASVLGTLAVQ